MQNTRIPYCHPNYISHHIIQQAHQRKIENINKKLSSKDDEISRLRNHNKTLITEMKKLKKQKKLQQETIKQLTGKESIINKDPMTDSVDIETLSMIQTETMKQGTDTNMSEIL